MKFLAQLQLKRGCKGQVSTFDLYSSQEFYCNNGGFGLQFFTLRKVSFVRYPIAGCMKFHNGHITEKKQMLSQQILIQSNSIEPQKTSLQSQLYEIPLNISSLSIELLAKYVDLIKTLYKHTYDQIAELTRYDDKLTFSSVIQPLINLDIYTEKIKSLCIFSQHVHQEEDVRKASAEAEKELENLNIECEHREDVFRVVQSYESDMYLSEKSKLSAEENKFIDILLRNYKRNGLYIPDTEKKEKIIELRKRLSSLCIEFDHNLDEDKTQLTFTEAELEGVPESYIKRNRISENLCKIPVKNQDMQIILNNAVNRNTRKIFFIAYESRCEHSNVPILKEILEIRQAIATILGYKTHADYVSEIRMVKNGINIRSFLEDMNNRFTPLLNSNLKDITEFARNMLSFRQTCVTFNPANL
jgi:Zn-dependent oligopeptidase